MYLEKYSVNSDERHMSFKEERLVYFSNNHVSIGRENNFLMTSYVYITDDRAIKEIK